MARLFEAFCGSGVEAPITRGSRGTDNGERVCDRWVQLDFLVAADVICPT